MIKTTPPMGWNSWNTFGENVNEQVIMEHVDTMVELGLPAYGYEYVVIDDCWSLRERDDQGRLVADPAKFPHGMKALADYVHSKGLKFGIYSCAGNLTCAAYPGSFEHEFVDAATFAEWGIDFLKYDYCFHSNIIHGKYLYRRMGLALKNCGRDILFSACSWGHDDTPKWIRETGANMWRSTGDVFDNWRSVCAEFDKQEAMLPYGGAGCFNDMDMLVVGMHGVGNVGFGGMNDLEYRTHFSLWCLFGSPLMMGCDLRQLDSENLATMTNQKAIAIDQDPACRQVMHLEGVHRHTENYARLMDNGDIAVCCVNFRDEDDTAQFTLDELGLPESTGKTLAMEEVWTGEQITVKNGTFSHLLPSHGCLLFRCQVVDA